MFPRSSREESAVPHWTMQPTLVGIAALGALAGFVAPLSAQTFPFSRTLDASAAEVLAIETTRGRIDVSSGSGPLLVEGTVVVRIGWNVPVDAPRRARAVAASPPIELTGEQVRLTLPADARDRDAVTIHWRVRVPPTMKVDVRTQSGEVRMADLGAPAGVQSGSGAISVRGARGGIAVTGQSGAIELARLAGDVRVRTGSGNVRIDMAGPGAVDVATSSSAIDVQGAGAGVQATSGSGAIRIAGTPTADWFVETSSSRIVLLPGRENYRLDLQSRSGRITSDRSGDVSGGHALVQEAGAGALLTARSGSGAIELRSRGPS